MKNYSIPLKTESMKNLYLQLNFRKLPLFREELRLTSADFNGLSSKKLSYTVSVVIAMLFAATCFAQTGINAFTSTMGTATNGQTLRQSIYVIITLRGCCELSSRNDFLLSRSSAVGCAWACGAALGA